MQNPDLPLLQIVISCRNIEELRKKAAGPFSKKINSRYTSLKGIMAAEPDASNKVKETWAKKLAPLERVNSLYENASKDDAELSEEQRKAREDHFTLGNAIWQAEFRRFAATLEKEIVGPLSLGEACSYLLTRHILSYDTRGSALARRSLHDTLHHSPGGHGRR